MPHAAHGRNRCALVLVAIALTATDAHAIRTGITGYSGKQSQTCNACHGGGTVPEAVRFEGPTEVAAGATATFRFVLVSEAPSQDEAGFNVSASGGTLRVIAGQGARLVGSELTHTSPKDIDDDEAAWQFDWTAPAAAGSQTLYGAGNAVNGNRTTTGDRALATTFVIQVMGSPVTPTASPTATIAPPTATAPAVPTAILEPSASATPSSTPPPPTLEPTATATSPCVGDCDANRRVTVAELVSGVNIALERAAVATCPAFDRDGDQRVTVAELVEGVRRLLEGC